MVVHSFQSPATTSAATTTTTTLARRHDNLPHTNRQTSNNNRHHSHYTTRLHVFERMSEDCIAALVTAQEQTSKYNLEAVTTETMVIGCMDHPESTALQRTLQQYHITWRQGIKTIDVMYTAAADDDDAAAANNKNEKGWLSGFRAAKQDTDRPFDAALKRALTQAGKLANQMGSPVVRTHHVFLALLEYSENSSSSTTSTSTKQQATATTDNDAWNFLVQIMQTTVDTDTTSALDVCQSLIRNLENDESNDSINNNNNSGKNKKELVTGQGSSDSAKTPTLADCGKDLTQQASDGLLDPVFGRDKEIRSCLRTLIRRRKNNVCLIGEAGMLYFFLCCVVVIAVNNNNNCYLSYFDDDSDNNILCLTKKNLSTRCRKDGYCRGSCSDTSRRD